MRKYELMLILQADADESVVSRVVERVGQVIGEHGGSVGNIDRWGRRRFSYEIDKQTEGYYVVVELTAEPGSITELERVLALADDVIRQKVVVAPPKAAA